MILIVNIMMTVMHAEKKNKIVLGLSGGVDSTAAALLLKEKGFEVIGLYFNVLNDNEYVEISAGREKAEKAARHLGVDLIYRDVSSLFDDVVIEDFCNGYISGRTPNPCIICNPGIKFKVLLETADEIGAEYISTGHYARVGRFADCDDMKDRPYCVLKGANEAKDQSYMLYRLGQDVLSRLILPLGQIPDKKDVRNLARKAGLENADDSESQEICFIAEGEDYVEFIRKRAIVPEGDFVDSSGKVLGKHRGIINYTIGQRKGLGIALGKPAFVTAINSKENTVTLGGSDELLHKTVVSEDNVFIDKNLTKNILCKQIMAKIRYAAPPAPASIKIHDDGTVLTEFEESQRAPTPGQSIVFYIGDAVVGGGIIK